MAVIETASGTKYTEADAFDKFKDLKSSIATKKGAINSDQKNEELDCDDKNSKRNEDVKSDNTIAGGPGDGKNDKNKNSGGDKLKGGKQKNRDTDIKKYPQDYQKRYHRGYKPDVRPGRNGTPRELEEGYKLWEQTGKPVAMAGFGHW